jgi:hypothetical protein
MEPRDGKGPGDASAPRKRRAPSARKRGPKAVNSAEQNGATATEPEVTSQTEATSAQATPGEQTPDLGDGDERGFGDRDAANAANVAADLKSWLDTRREDRDGPREVL